jgi:hypothetical protein
MEQQSTKAVMEEQLTETNFFERNNTRLLAWTATLVWGALVLWRLPATAVATLWGVLVLALPPALFMLVASSKSSRDRQAILDFLSGLRGTKTEGLPEAGKE